METGTQLTVQQRASLALGSSKHEAKLIELAKQSTAIVAITNPASYKELHSARMALKTERVQLEKEGKAARDDATKFSKAVIEEEKRLIAIIEPEEMRLRDIQEEYDTRVERERAAKIEAERQRVERIQFDIDHDIKAIDTGLTVMSGSVVIETRLADLRAIAITVERFNEFASQAEQAKVLAVIRLNQLLTGAVEYEAAQRKAKADAEELARMRADEERRKAEAAAVEAEANRRRAEEAAAAQARIAEQERQAQLRIEAQERKAREEREEADRVARIAREAEERKVAEERERVAAEARALEQRQREAREEQELIERTARLKQEEEERAAREQAEQERLAAEAAARSEQEALEASARESRRKADELTDTITMLVKVCDRCGNDKQFAGVVKAINAYFAKHGDPRRGEPKGGPDETIERLTSRAAA